MRITKKLLLAFGGGAGFFFVVLGVYLLIAPFGLRQPAIIFLRSDDDAIAQISKQTEGRMGGFRLLCWMFGPHLRPGRYEISPEDNSFTVFRRMCNGQQTPVRLVLPSVRTMEDLAAFLSEHLMLDAQTVSDSLSDSVFTSRFGYSVATVPALFVPNTYEVYWNTSLDGFMHRMQREHKAFWSQERLAKANALGLSPEEVATLASIIDEETANNAEKPMIAGMYIHRLRLGMPLQADPTVKFALHNFSLRRILKEHLSVRSPYNTYVQPGLPPGPIRVASVAGIDAVLHAVLHDKIYMCAKEDFSGTHNFASTYAEHLQNARRYQEALDKRGIR